MAVPPSLPQLERNRFRYHLPLSTLYPRRFSTFLHLIPSPTALLPPPSLLPWLNAKFHSAFFRRSSVSRAPILSLLSAYSSTSRKERERDTSFPLPFLSPFLTLRHVLHPASFPSPVSSRFRPEARDARLYVDIASLLTGAKDVYDICLTLIGKCFDSLSVCLSFSWRVEVVERG